MSFAAVQPLSLVRPVLHMFRANRRHRRVILDLIKRDFRVRYLGSLMGGIWNVLHPLAMITIYTVVFSRIMHQRAGMDLSTGKSLDYTVYLCSALIPWNAFVETVSRSTRAFLDHGALIKKVAFPMDILHAVVAGSATVTFSIAYSLYLLFCIFLGHEITWGFLLIPVFYVLQLFFAIGIGMVLSILNVFYRDVEQAIGIVFQIWFWVTPIMYYKSTTPGAFSYVFKLNPFYYFAEAYHQLTFHSFPSSHVTLACVLLAAGSFWIGSLFMSKMKLEIPDEL